MKKIIELFTITINHLLNIYLAEIELCLSIYRRNARLFAVEKYKVNHLVTGVN